jgi:hypothetical protein
MINMLKEAHPEFYTQEVQGTTSRKIDT